MKKTILFGASGNLGKEIAKELVQQGYDLTVVVRNQKKADELKAITSGYVIADITDPNSLVDICRGYDFVVSSLGKSVSLNDKSKPSFYDIDLLANSNILEEAKKSGVKKFVYVSALGAENNLHLTYFKVHHDFSERLKASGINYLIIKPPAIMCAFLDVMEMAKKGQLMNLGNGDKKTNPIYEGDLAKVCIDSIKQDNAVIEAGGKHIYSRKQINEVIQQTVAPNKKIRSMPMWMVKCTLPLIRIFDKNMYDKFAFYLEVMQHDLLAPQVGKMKFEDYILSKNQIRQTF